jgi:hypothetical protein
MKKMGEVGAEKLLKAVDIANASGAPTYKKVEELLCLEHKPLDAATGTDELGQALLDDEFYVEQRDPSAYDALWEKSPQPGAKK